MRGGNHLIHGLALVAFMMCLRCRWLQEVVDRRLRLHQGSLLLLSLLQSSGREAATSITNRFQMHVSSARVQEVHVWKCKDTCAMGHSWLNASPKTNSLSELARFGCATCWPPPMFCCCTAHCKLLRHQSHLFFISFVVRARDAQRRAWLRVWVASTGDFF